MSHVLDARNLNCPLPILRTRKALSGLSSGIRIVPCSGLFGVFPWRK